MATKITTKQIAHNGKDMDRLIEELLEKIQSLEDRIIKLEKQNISSDKR
jgi:hypothetical protein